MEHLLFAAYLIFFSWLVTKTGFFKASGLTMPQLVILLLLKVLAGILYGWIGVYYGELAQMVDTWGYHYEAKTEYELLKTNPSQFFSSIFQNSYGDGYTRFLASENSWWNDLKGTFFVKMLAVFNLASFGYYYVNVIFYSYLTLFGPIAVYRVMKDLFPSRSGPILLATFLVPSFLYWTSGLHKDGLIFIGLSLMFYHIYFGMKEGGFSVRRFLIVLLGFLLVLALRNFLIIPVLPAVIAWLLAHRFQKKMVWVFAGVYTVFVILFFTARLIHPRFDFPEEVVSRQKAFLALGGGSAVEVSPLQPTVGSFIANAPQSVALTMLRPYPSDVKHLLSLAASVEINLLLILLLLFLFVPGKGHQRRTALLFCVFLSLSVLLMIGYSVNVLGAIVRYRSIILPFLIVPIVAKIDWTRTSSWINRNIMKN